MLFNFQENQYLDVLKKLDYQIELNKVRGGTGYDVDDRTGVGTQNTFGVQMRFDLRRGFPLFTHKQVFMRGIFEELMWFLRGETNIKTLVDKNVKIWNEWKKPYSLDRKVVFVNQKVVDYVPYDGDYTFKGFTEHYPVESVEYKLLKTWECMMKRCYDTKRHNFKFYGGAGSSVCKDWHNPLNFVKDVQELPHWKYKLDSWGDFELDKDYYGANHYSPETCVWLSKRENAMYMESSKPISVTDPEGLEKVFMSLSEASQGVGIAKTSLHRFIHNGMPKVLKGNNKNFIGFEFNYKEVEGKLARLELIKSGDMGSIYSHQWRNFGGDIYEQGFDQIEWVINEIKTNPTSRRLIVSGWNPQDVNKGDVALPPCHTLFQFFVKNGKLSCQLYQRSADLLLGVPFNIASYALLTHLVALECGLDVGEFVWVGGDCHIYSNQEHGLKEIVNNRIAFEAPSIKINKRDSIYDYTWEDIEIVGYKHQGKVEMPVAV